MYHHCCTFSVTYLAESVNVCWVSQIAKFMGPAWGPPGSCRPQMCPMLTPWTLLSGIFYGRYSDVTMGAMASQNTGVSIVYSTVCSDADQKIHQSYASMVFGVDSKITSEFSAQWASNAENVSVWWRHQGECSWYSAIIHEQLSHFSFDWEGNSPFVWWSMINDLWNYVNNGCTLGNNTTIAEPISKPIWQLNKTWMIRLMLVKILFCTNGIAKCTNQCYPLLIHIIT